MRIQLLVRRMWLVMSAVFIFVSTSPYAMASTQIRATADHSVLLKNDGTVWQWGAVGYGRQYAGGACANSTTVSSVPVQVKGLGAVQAIATAGGTANLALVADGTVWGWGLDPKIDCRQSSGGNVAPYMAVWQIKDPLDPTGFLKNVTGIWAGSGSYFARKSDGTVWAWGNNDTNKLGIQAPAKSTSTTNPPADVATIATPMKVGNSVSYPKGMASGGSHTLVTSYNNAGIKAWGGNAYGQRGDGSYNHSSFPSWNGHAWYDLPTSALIDGVTDIAAGDYKSMAIKNDGTVWGWGWNRYGDLGNGIPWGDNTDGSNTPVQVAGLSGASAIAMGKEHSVVLLADGTVWAFGYNGSGQLGNGTPAIPRSTTPSQVIGLNGVTAIDASEKCSIALKNDGTLWEWGLCHNDLRMSAVQVNFPAIADAACGAANGQSFSTAPTKNLCLVGTPTQVAGSGPWTWNCTLSNGRIASCAATTGPYILTNPSTVKKFQGQTATLSVVAQGIGQLQYQWYKDGVPVRDGRYLIQEKPTPLRPRPGQLQSHEISGATTAQLKIVNLRAADSGTYHVVVKDQTGAAVSKTAQVNVLLPVPSKPRTPLGR